MGPDVFDGVSVNVDVVVWLDSIDAAVPLVPNTHWIAPQQPVCGCCQGPGQCRVGKRGD